MSKIVKTKLRAKQTKTKIFLLELNLQHNLTLKVWAESMQKQINF